jgi:hypothetical protein
MLEVLCYVIITPACIETYEEFLPIPQAHGIMLQDRLR